MDTRNQSCKDRIKPNFDDRMYNIKRVVGHVKANKQWLNDYDMPSDIGERIDQFMTDSILEFEPNGNKHGVSVPRDMWHVTVLLSTGGPADGFILGVKKGRFGYQVVSVWYWFQDWFDGATMKVRSESENEKVLIELFESSLELIDIEKAYEYADGE